MFENDSPNLVLTASVDWLKQKQWQQDPAWLQKIRKEGREGFERMGLPHRRMEEWKYTDLSALSQQPFLPPHPVSLEIQEKLAGNELLNRDISPIKLVFVNGFYSPLLSSTSSLPPGVEIVSLSQAIKEDHRVLKKHLGAYSWETKNGFTALNHALIEDGALIYVPKGIKVSTPVHLIYMNLEKDVPHVLYPRNLMIFEAGASAQVIEEYVGENEAVYLTNSVTEIFTDKGARVSHYKLQRESEEAFHMATIQVRQAEDSHFASYNITFGGQITRNNIYTSQTGSGAHCDLHGLYMISGRQHVDNHTLIDHQAPDCTSGEWYHGILDGKAHGVFNGRIYVHREAQRIDSQQTSRALLLSREAAVDAKPQLEIFADDVKCSHGATVGRIDKDALYYLRSRGITKKESRKMLTLAFARRIVDRMELDSLRWELDKTLGRQLDQWEWEQS